jgi:polysaccharide chain length determinant protein (PEP-CTERM system associated)
VLEVAWAAWSRRKWLAIVTFIVPFLAATSFITFMPNIYQSTATLLVERQQVPEALVRPTVTGEFETRLRTISQEIMSRSRLEALIARFGLYADLKSTHPAEGIVERMRGDILLDVRAADARGGRSSTVAFAITYRGRDPETVAQVTNTLASFYIDENLKIRERQATGIAQFLKIQLEDTRKRLDVQERQVSEFKKRHVGELPQQMQANLATLEQLNTQLRLNSVNRLRLEEKRDLVAMQLPDTLTPGAPAAALAPPASQPEALRLPVLYQQLDELETRFTDRHPSVIRKKAEIATLEQRIARDQQLADANPDAQRADRKPDARPPVALTPHGARLRQALGEVNAEINVLSDEDKRLRNAVATYERRVTNTPQREQEFQELARDYESTKELYQSLAKRYDEAQLAESMEQRQKGEQFRILDAALASVVPAAPKRFRLLVVALVGSAALAIGIVGLAEAFDTSFHTLDALRSFTTVPVIVSIPRLVMEADVRGQQRRFRLAAAGTTIVLAFVVGLSYLFAHGNEALVRW